MVLSNSLCHVLRCKDVCTLDKEVHVGDSTCQSLSLFTGSMFTIYGLLGYVNLFGLLLIFWILYILRCCHSLFLLGIGKLFSQLYVHSLAEGHVFLYDDSGVWAQEHLVLKAITFYSDPIYLESVSSICQSHDPISLRLNQSKLVQPHEHIRLEGNASIK